MCRKTSEADDDDDEGTSSGRSKQAWVLSVQSVPGCGTLAAALLSVKEGKARFPFGPRPM